MNNSSTPFKIVRADELYDLDVRLVSPGGRAISAFRDMPGAKIKHSNKRFFIEDLNPANEVNDSINLAFHFPLLIAGEYRCLLTKRIYREDPGFVPGGPHDPPGTPIDLVSSEFRFRIESIDLAYKSPLAAAVPESPPPERSAPSVSQKTPILPGDVPPTQPAPKASEVKRAPTRAEQPGSTPWIVWIITIVAAIGLLWLLLKKRK